MNNNTQWYKFFDFKICVNVWIDIWATGVKWVNQFDWILKRRSVYFSHFFSLPKQRNSLILVKRSSKYWKIICPVKSILSWVIPDFRWCHRRQFSRLKQSRVKRKILSVLNIRFTRWEKRSKKSVFLCLLSTFVNIIFECLHSNKSFIHYLMP